MAMKYKELMRLGNENAMNLIVDLKVRDKLCVTKRKVSEP